MENKQTYKKGDRVWVEIPVEGNTPSKHLALILSLTPVPTYYKQELHFAVRYLDKVGADAYQCIPRSWIVGHVDKEEANNF